MNAVHAGGAGAFGIMPAIIDEDAVLRRYFRALTQRLKNPRVRLCHAHSARNNRWVEVRIQPPALIDRGVLIREVGPTGYLRVCAGTPRQTDAFRTALLDVLPTAPRLVLEEDQ